MDEKKKWLVSAILVDDGNSATGREFLSVSEIMDCLFNDLPARLQVDKMHVEEVTELDIETRRLPG